MRAHSLNSFGHSTFPRISTAPIHSSQNPTIPPHRARSCRLVEGSPSAQPDTPNPKLETIFPVHKSR
jgi:hypothetical protein